MNYWRAILVMVIGGIFVGSIFLNVGRSPGSAARAADQLAAATLVTLNPTEDTFVSNIGRESEQNFGTVPVLNVYSDANGGRMWSLLKFDLSSIPYGSVINSATLRLQQVGATPAGAAWFVNLYQAGGSWTETGVTWNTKPVTGTLISSEQITASVGIPVDWDAKLAVSNWVNYPGSNPNNGFYLQGTGSGDFSRQFNSREAGKDLPQLIIDYTPPPDKATVPYDTTAVELDHVCSVGQGEYPRTPILLYNDANGRISQLYLKHDDKDLYVCVEGAIGSLKDRFFAVYLDTDNGREPFAEGDDFQLGARIEYVDNFTAKGTGSGNYSPTTLAGWTAAAGINLSAEKEVAEYKIPLDLTGMTCKDKQIGLAVYHHWFAFVGNDYGWPSNRWYDQPQTWVTINGAGLPPCGGPTATPTNTPVPPTPTSTPLAPTPTPVSTPIWGGPIFALPLKPIVTDPVLTLPIDVSIHGIELTQGIQCFNPSTGLSAAQCPDNSLQLANKKDTTARIYLKSGGIFSSIPNVPVRLYIRANGVWYTANANGKATTTINQGNTDSADVYFNVNFTNDVVVDFYAVVDPNNTIAEINESNNRFPAVGYLTRTFYKRGTMKVVGQRLRYHPPGYTGTQYAGGWAVNGGGADFFEQMLPIRNNGINYQIASGYLDWTGTLGTGDGQHALIQYLNSQWLLQNVLSWLLGTGPFTGARHVYGWAPNQGYSGGHADMPVYPHAGGLGVVGIGTDNPGTSTDNPGSGALIMVHELLHDYDLKHTDTGADDCGSDDSSSAFPYSTSSIQEFGFNPITGKIYDPSQTHDVLSYCPAGGSKLGWISPYTWNYMSTRLDADARSQRPMENIVGMMGSVPLRANNLGETLVVNATIYNPDAPGYNPAMPGKLTNLNRVATGLELLLPGTGYAIQLRNGSTAVYTETFGISFTSEYASSAFNDRHATSPDTPPFPPEDTAQADVSLAIPWINGTTQVVLLKGTTVLASQNVSANSPVVSFTAPSGPASYPAGTMQTVSWSGSDADGDTLSYSLLYSRNGGSTWELLVTGLAATSYQVDVDAFAGSTNGRFAVVATDGVNTGSAQSPNVTIPNKKPSAIITNPVQNGIYSPGALIVMQGMGVDLEDGVVPDGQLSWSSNRQGVLGTGPSFPTNSLLRGPHTITFTVTDSQGAQQTATVKITVGTGAYLPTINR